MKQSELPEANDLEAILASLRLWLLDVIARLLEAFGPRRPFTRDIAALLRKSLHKAEYDTKRAILGLAVLRMRMPKLPRTLRPPPGFALRRYDTSHIRLLTHSVFNGRPLNLRARIARLRDILENVELWTARLLKRLQRGFNFDPRILAEPPVARAFTAPAPSLAPADSS